jgi:hypothetical protein
MSHPVSFKPSASRRAVLAMARGSLVAASLRAARASPIGGTDLTTSTYGEGTLPKGVRSCLIHGVNGLDIHILEAGCQEGVGPDKLSGRAGPSAASWRSAPCATRLGTLWSAPIPFFDQQLLSYAKASWQKPLRIIGETCAEWAVPTMDPSEPYFQGWRHDPGCPHHRSR